MNWLSSLVSASFMSLDAAKRRVRRSLVGLIIGKVLTLVCGTGVVSQGSQSKGSNCYLLEKMGAKEGREGCDDGAGK